MIEPQDIAHAMHTLTYDDVCTSSIGDDRAAGHRARDAYADVC
jgi:hypothetical protein